MTSRSDTLHVQAARLSSALLIAIVVVFTGCGPGRLSRSKAEQLIVAAIKAGPPVVIAFPTGAYGSSRPGGHFHWVEPLLGKGLVTLKSLGTMDKITEYGLGMRGKTTYNVFSVDLTSEGQKYKVREATSRREFNDQYTPYSPFHPDVTHSYMRVAEPVFVAVTGIVEQIGGKSADVEFTWKYDNITPFGQVAPLLDERLSYSTTIRKGRVTVTRYDDGWRLPNGWSLAR